MKIARFKGKTEEIIEEKVLIKKIWNGHEIVGSQ